MPQVLKNEVVMRWRIVVEKQDNIAAGTFSSGVTGRRQPKILLVKNPVKCELGTVSPGKR
jgi:hypothetical protein